MSCEKERGNEVENEIERRMKVVAEKLWGP